jgi:hypothetical protein
MTLSDPSFFLDLLFVKGHPLQQDCGHCDSDNHYDHYVSEIPGFVDLIVRAFDGELDALGDLVETVTDPDHHRMMANWDRLVHEIRPVRENQGPVQDPLDRQRIAIRNSEMMNTDDITRVLLFLPSTQRGGRTSACSSLLDITLMDPMRIPRFGMLSMRWIYTINPTRDPLQDEWSDTYNSWLYDSMMNP